MEVKMNILFLTMQKIRSLNQDGIYMDLMNEFVDNGHHVFVATPLEKQDHLANLKLSKLNMDIFGVKICDYFTNSLLKKGISLLLLNHSFLVGIKKQCPHVTFDLIIYSTPPISFNKTISFFKNRGHAFSYLLLKDIFPQNAVDLGMIEAHGPTSLIYKVFRRKEKKLYKVSDAIGCMSQANCDYLLANNPEVAYDKVEICPNSIKIREHKMINKEKIRIKYSLPMNKTIFIYGGNIGRPQGVDFIISCLRGNELLLNSFILIIGKGTEYSRLQKWFGEVNPKNAKLIPFLPKNEFDLVVACSDIGLLFLDNRFTIPNFPSRLLSYMEYDLPVLAATDSCSDVGKTIMENGFGWWCKSDDASHFLDLMDTAAGSDLRQMKQNEKLCLKTRYSVETSYKTIMGHFQITT